MTAFQETPPVEEVTDFIISCFREELGLWFELNEAKSPRRRNVAFADLTDGDSSLFLWFVTEVAGFDDSLLLPQLGDVSIAWHVREDSRRIFARDLIVSTAMNALSRFSGPIPRTIARVSFEFQLSTPLGNEGIASWFQSSSSGMTFQPMPDYGGKYADLPVDDDGRACWAQVLFAWPMTHRDVVGLLSPGLIGLNHVEFGTSVRYDAAPEWQFRGVERAYLLARRY